MKLLFVTANLAYRGVSKQCMLLARALHEAGLDISVIVVGRWTPWANEVQSAGVPVQALDWLRPLDLPAWRRLHRFVHEAGADVIHAWGLSALRALGPMMESQHLIVSDALPPRDQSALRTAWDRRLLRRAKIIIAHHAGQAAQYQRLGADRVPMIPYAIDTGQQESNSPDGMVPRLPEHARRVVCVGPLEPDKGHRDAIWAFDILKYVYPNLRLILAGDGSERHRLQTFARAIGVAEEVCFTGTLPSVRAVLTEAEIVWVPSHTAAGLQTALEAMAEGRPLIASRLPGLADIVVENETGYLFRPGDKVTLARRTRLLLEDTALARRLGEAGQQRVHKQFALSGIVRRYRDLYAGALG